MVEPHVTSQNQLRGAGSDNSLFTNDLTVGDLPRMLGRPYILSDYAPSFSGTTGASSLVTVGSFDNFVVAMRVGMRVELIPHILSSGVPTGQRGWLAWARAGSDSVNDNAFRLLANA
jgi:HK97 family phage major capsid protein